MSARICDIRAIGVLLINGPELLSGCGLKAFSVASGICFNSLHGKGLPHTADVVNGADGSISLCFLILPRVIDSPVSVVQARFSVKLGIPCVETLMHAGA